MSIVIQLKHTTTKKTADSAGLFTTLAELAYTFVDGDSDGGDRLFIGNPDGGADIIGGKYYIDMMDHPKGDVVPSSAIITDSNNKINQLKIDELTIDSDTITANGNLILDPILGNVSVNSHKIQNVIDPVSPQDAATKNYVDQLELINIKADVEVGSVSKLVPTNDLELAGGFNLNTIRTDLDSGKKVSINLDSNLVGLASIEIDNVRIDGNTVGTTSGNLILDPAAIGDNTGTVIIAGDLQVDGTQTTLNSTTLTVDDKNIVLAQGAVNAAAANGAGVTIDGASATILYTSATDTWNFNKKIVVSDIEVSGAVTSSTLSGKYLGFDSDFDTGLTNKTTSDLTEGTNLYFTDERVDDRVAALLSAAEGLDAVYNDLTGVLTLSAEIATQTNKGVAAFDSVDFAITSGQVEIRTIDCGTY